MTTDRKFADELADWLVELGYTTCFFVAGGNSMHLLAAMRSRVTCIPVVHEVTAGIAVEYFNEHSVSERSFALVTAGPGLTNIVTAIAGSWLESRPMLVIGGQVKSSDLASGGMRQRGIQEIDGISIVRSITKAALRVEVPMAKSEFMAFERLTREGRRGPCFLEVCLDAQAMSPAGDSSRNVPFDQDPISLPVATDSEFDEVVEMLSTAQRPALLIGGGLSRHVARSVASRLDSWGVPILTSWNGADRYASDRAMWFGRPDTWGMRSSNLIMQQADLLVVLGARLGLQQTGFAWEQFVPMGKVIHVDLDPAETGKGHPRTTLALNVDANDLLIRLLGAQIKSRGEWVEYCQSIMELVPLEDNQNSSHPGFLNPYRFVVDLSNLCAPTDAIVPCSSGGANTVMMQAFLNKSGQVFFNDRALASMGYGLAGAIGAAIASKGRRTVLVEGDGGFAQNLQELATVDVNRLNLKMFVLANEGYASIRMTQRNYFNGEYLGCDVESGLGFPDWTALAAAYGVPSFILTDGYPSDAEFLRLWNGSGPVLFVVPVHPEQTYFPKITSRVTTTGSMESNPLHLMSPELADGLRSRVGRYLL